MCRANPVHDTLFCAIRASNYQSCSKGNLCPGQGKKKIMPPPHFIYLVYRLNQQFPTWSLLWLGGPLLSSPFPARNRKIECFLFPPALCRRSLEEWGGGGEARTVPLYQYGYTIGYWVTGWSGNVL